MRMNIEERDVQTIGTAETTKFKIAASGKAFKILIDGLYSDKPRAAIRELWSNAFDSHAEAGKSDVPFDVHLPSLFEPHFSVRDYGISMTHETVMGLYSTVFESTKEQTNDAVGMLGLGSKSPYAYTDAFTVTVWLDGEVRVYSAYLDRERCPCIDLMDRSPSTEPQGVEVSFPVDTMDVREFAQKTGEVARGFPVQPNIDVPDREREIFEEKRNIETLYTGDGWSFYVNPDRYASAQAFARQGCVLYPIDPNSIKDCDEPTKIILQANTIIDFPIGEVDIAASREGLSYDPETQANIVKRAASAYKEVTEQFVAEFNSCKTRWEATAKYQEIMADKSISDTVSRILGSTLKFQGRKLTDEIHFRVKEREMLGRRVMQVTDRQSINGLTARHKNAWDGKWAHNGTAFLRPGKDIIYLDIVGDGKNTRGRGLNIAHHFRHNHVVGNNFGTKRCVWVKCDANTSQAARFMIMAGRPDKGALHIVSELPEAPKEARAQYTRATVKCKEAHITGPSSMNWISSDISSDDDNVLYIETTRGRMNDFNYMWSDYDFAQAHAFLLAVGKIDADTKIVQIPATHRKKIERAGGKWQRLRPILQEVVESRMTPELIMLLNEKGEFTGETHIHELCGALIQKGVLPTHRGALREATIKLKIIERKLAREGNVNNLRRLAEQLNVPVLMNEAERACFAKIISEETKEKAWEEVVSRYPMLQYMDLTKKYYGGVKKVEGDKLSHMAEYIETVDRAS